MIGLVFIAVSVSCGSAKQGVNKGEMAVVKQLVASGRFLISQEVAEPLANSTLNSLGNAGLLGNANTGSTIFLDGNADEIKVADGKVAADMSYYGDVRIPINQNRRQGVFFNTEPQDYKVTYNEKKETVEISFNARNEIEVFFVTITVYPNNKTATFITASNRTSIRYLGKLMPIENEE